MDAHMISSNIEYLLTPSLHTVLVYKVYVSIVFIEMYCPLSVFKKRSPIHHTD